MDILFNWMKMTLGMWSLSLDEVFALTFRWNCRYRYHYYCCCYCYFHCCCESWATAEVLQMN